MKINEKAIQSNENFKSPLNNKQTKELLDCGGMKKCKKCDYLMFQLFAKCPKCGADVKTKEQKELKKQSRGR